MIGVRLIELSFHIGGEFFFENGRIIGLCPWPLATALHQTNSGGLLTNVCTKLVAKFPIWEIAYAFSKLLKMLASGSVSTSRPPKSGFVVPVDLMQSFENSHHLTGRNSFRLSCVFRCCA